jgi:uncharacterized protein YjbJ (UPF0337 family)
VRLPLLPWVDASLLAKLDKTPFQRRNNQIAPALRTRWIGCYQRTTYPMSVCSKPRFPRPGLHTQWRNCNETHMDWNRIQGIWKQFGGKVKEKWGKLTDDDLAVINGRRDQLEGKIQERYGTAKDQVRSNVDTRA